MTTPAQRHEYSCIDARQRELDAARALVLAVEQVVDAYDNIFDWGKAKLPTGLRQALEVLADTYHLHVGQDDQ